MLKFNEISGEKFCFNEDDLRQYAINNGLPVNYVRSFMQAASGGNGWNAPGGLQQVCVNYEKFSAYVRSRESALKQAFEALDISKRGAITAEELEIALSHVRVKCPESKCVYRCKKQVVHDFVHKVTNGQKSSFHFDDFRNFFLLLPKNDMLMDYYMSARDCSPCDIGGCVVLHKKTGGNPMGHLLAGAMSGAVSRTVTAPLETIRIMAMTGSAPKGGTLEAAHSLLQSAGWRGLFKGNGVNVMRSAPQKALDFFAFEGFKKLVGSARAEGDVLSCPLVPRDERAAAQLGFGETLLAAGLAGAVSSTTLYPLEVLRSRITCDATGAYRGVLDAFRKVVSREGPRALYAGVGPSIAAIVPEAAITYGMFDILKKKYSEVRGVPEPSVVVSLAFGVCSAFMGQVVAYPLETIARRMQVQQSGCGGGAADIARGIVESNGVGGLYAGIRASLLKVLPMALFSFGTYELVRIQLNQLADSLEEQQIAREGQACRGCQRPVPCGR